jgi:hypothetical protein
MVVGRTMSRVTVSTVTSEGCGRTITITAAIAPKGGPSSARLRSNYRYHHQPYISAPVYLFSCACGSGLDLKGVISSSSRHTTRFLNRHPCEVFTNVSS